jgi:hypothetical protein
MATRLITAFGVNSLRMCASSEREPGPIQLWGRSGLRAAQLLRDLKGQAAVQGRGGFTGG